MRLLKCLIRFYQFPHYSTSGNLREGDRVALPGLPYPIATDAVHIPDNAPCDFSCVCPWSNPLTTPGYSACPPQLAYPPPSPTVKVLIYGRGLPPHILRESFSQYGKIFAPVVVHVGGRPDYAYIYFSSPEEASRAVSWHPFWLKGALLFTKLSTKLELQLRDSDNLVNLLMATTFLENARSEVKFFEVEVSALNGECGIQVTGDSEEVPEAFRQLESMCRQIKDKITTRVAKVHCKTLPILMDGSSIKQLAKKKAVEFAVICNDGQPMCVGDFTAIINRLSREKNLVNFSDVAKLLAIENLQTRNPLWKFTDDSGTYRPMSRAHSESLEKLFQENQDSDCSQLTWFDWTYSYNFRTMKQTNLVTKQVRNITRTSLQPDYFSIQCRSIARKMQPGMTALNHLLHKSVIQRTIHLPQLRRTSADNLAQVARQYLVELVSASEGEIVLSGVKGPVERVELILKDLAGQYNDQNAS